MTHPTKAIVGTLLKDFVKVSGGRSDGALYTEKDLEKTLDVTEVIDFHQTVEVAGIQVCHTAALLGHCSDGHTDADAYKGTSHSLAFLQTQWLPHKCGMPCCTESVQSHIVCQICLRSPVICR